MSGNDQVVAIDKMLFSRAAQYALAQLVAANTSIQSLVSGYGNTGSAASFIQPSINANSQSVPAGWSWSDDLQFSLPGVADAFWIAPVWANYDTTQSVTMGGKGAFSGVDKAAASTLTWGGFTVGGASSWTLAAATAGVGKNIPTFAVADPLPLTAFARSDGGTSLLVRVITTLTTSGVARTIQFHNKGTTAMTALMADSEANGFQVAGQFTNNADWKTTTPSSAPASNANVPSLCVGVIVGTSARGIVGAVFCDSRGAGTGSTSNAIGWPHRVNFQGKAVTLLNFSEGGEAVVDSIAKMKAFVSRAAAGYKPSFVVLNGPSPNDASASTLAGNRTAYANLLAAAEWCRQQGVVCVLQTPIPSNSFYVNALQIYPKMLALQQSGWLKIVDTTASLCDVGAGSFTILGAYNSGDNIHLNNDGYKVVRDLFVTPALAW